MLRAEEGFFTYAPSTESIVALLPLSEVAPFVPDSSRW